MKDKDVKKQKGSDTDKAVAAPGLINTKKEDRSQANSQISQDTFLAEKDEVKNAEERLRNKSKTK